MQQQLIISVPDSMEFSTLPTPIQKLVFNNLKAIIPNTGWTMPGTQVFEGRRLVHLSSNADPDVMEYLIGLFNATSGADWQVEAAQEFHIKAQYDDEENFIGFEGVYKKVPPSLVNYLNDVDESGTRPEAPCALHTFAGAAQWVWDVT